MALAAQSQTPEEQQRQQRQLQRQQAWVPGRQGRHPKLRVGPLYELTTRYPETPAGTISSPPPKGGELPPEQALVQPSPAVPMRTTHILLRAEYMPASPAGEHLPAMPCSNPARLWAACLTALLHMHLLSKLRPAWVSWLLRVL